MRHAGPAMARRAVAGLEGVAVRIVADTLVETGPRRVERVLTNLVTNALRHGAAPVTVDVARCGDGPVVRARDHGTGFPLDMGRTGATGITGRTAGGVRGGRDEGEVVVRG